MLFGEEKTGFRLKVSKLWLPEPKRTRDTFQIVHRRKINYQFLCDTIILN
jgi:hypothetical protein